MAFGASIMLMKNTASFRQGPCVPVMHVAFIAAGKCCDFGNRELNVRHKDALLSVQSSVSKKKFRSKPCSTLADLLLVPADTGPAGLCT